MNYRIILLVLAVFVCCASVFGQAVKADPAAPQNYLIGPGDEVTGKVLGEPQFDFVATVDGDGRMIVPFIDDPVAAKCKTENQLRNEIATLLKRYLRDPQISVQVTKRDSRPPVSIYGEVRQQQQVILTRRAYLLELISFAGGPTEKSGGSIQVFRTHQPLCSEPSNTEKWGDADSFVPSRTFSLANLRDGHADSNPEILPGDIIIVEKAAPVYVTGEVIRPGEFSIPEAGLPLMQAVAMASGITREAKTKEIKVYRRKEGSPEPEVLVANYDAIRKGEQKDLMLQPFDIVEVGKAGKSFAQYLLEFATGIPNRIPIRPL